MLLLFTVMILGACSGGAVETLSDQAIQTAIAQTQAAQPMDTPTLMETQLIIDTLAPTNTPEPTKTVLPSPTPTETKSLEDFQAEFIQIIVDYLENAEKLEGIERVTLVRFGDPGVFEIELRTLWASKDRQPDVSYDVISNLAMVIVGGLDKDTATGIANGSDFILRFTTYSTDGDFRYQSESSFDLLEKVYNRAISYQEWVTEANAEFR